MKGLMPQEMEVWYLIPAIRSQIAQDLSTLGMKQKEIADSLGLTEAAISQYVSKKRAVNIDLDNKFKDEIKKSSKKILADKKTAPSEIQRLLQAAKKSKFLCQIHEKYGVVAEKGCELCCGK